MDLVGYGVGVIKLIEVCAGLPASTRTKTKGVAGKMLVEERLVGIRLKEEMEVKKVSGNELCEISGVKPAALHRVLHGKGMTVETLMKLCDALDMTPNDMLGY